MDLIELSSVIIFADRMYDQIRGKGWTYHISMSASITEGRYGHQLPIQTLATTSAMSNSCNYLGKYFWNKDTVHFKLATKIIAAMMALPDWVQDEGHLFKVVQPGKRFQGLQGNHRRIL